MSGCRWVWLQLPSELFWQKRPEVFECDSKNFRSWDFDQIAGTRIPAIGAATHRSCYVPLKFQVKQRAKFRVEKYKQIGFETGPVQDIWGGAIQWQGNCKQQNIWRRNPGRGFNQGLLFSLEDLASTHATRENLFPVLYMVRATEFAYLHARHGCSIHARLYGGWIPVSFTQRLHRVGGGVASHKCWSFLTQSNRSSHLTIKSQTSINLYTHQ